MPHIAQLPGAMKLPNLRKLRDRICCVLFTSRLYSALHLSMAEVRLHGATSKSHRHIPTSLQRVSGWS